jgi:hypothetical protein
MELKSGFKITLFSHPDYESLTAEIYFGDQFIAMITNESGIFKVELSSFNGELAPKFPFDAFQEALNSGRSRLSE